MIYSRYVLIDVGTGALLGHYQHIDDAIEEAKELSYLNRYGSYEVYGVDKDNFYDDDTLVFSTDD